MDISPEVARQIRDVNALCARMDNRIARLSTPSDPVPSGERFFALATAAVKKKVRQFDEAERIERAATGPAVTSDPSWAGALVPTSTVAGFLVAIGKVSAYASLASRGPSFTLQAPLPLVVGGAEIIASFVGEGEAIGVQEGAFAPATLDPRKIAVIVTLSEELAQSSNAEAALRRLLTSGVSSTLDEVFFGDAAASGPAPAGILNGLTPVAASTETPAEEAMRADLKALVAALDHPTDPVFVVSPDRLVYLSAALPGNFAYPTLASSGVPSDRVICVDADALVAGAEPEPRFSVSKNATLHLDTLPLPIGSPGTPTVVAAPSVSTYQQDLIALKTAIFLAWSLRDGAASFIDGPSW